MAQVHEFTRFKNSDSERALLNLLARSDEIAGVARHEDVRGALNEALALFDREVEILERVAAAVTLCEPFAADPSWRELLQDTQAKQARLLPR